MITVGTRNVLYFSPSHRRGVAMGLPLPVLTLLVSQRFSPGIGTTTYAGSSDSSPPPLNSVHSAPKTI